MNTKNKEQSPGTCSIPPEILGTLEKMRKYFGYKSKNLTAQRAMLIGVYYFNQNPDNFQTLMQKLVS